MLQLRQEPVRSDPLVFGLAKQKAAWHFVIPLAGFGVWAAMHAPAGPARVAALVALAAIAVWLGLAVTRRVATLKLGLGHDGIAWPGGALFVPWADVVKLALVDRGLPGPALVVEVREGSDLVARQRQAESRWERLQLARATKGRLECALNAYDRPPAEIFEAAAARFRAASRVELEASDDGPLSRELRRPGIAQPIPVAG